MPSFAHLTVALALIGTAVSAPSPINKRSAFTVPQVAGPKIIKNGAGEVIRTLRKFGKPVPQSLLDAAARSSGSVTATPDSVDSRYLCPVTVGTTQLNLDFDTGSADLWVFSSLQSQSELAGHSYYKVNPSKQKQGYSWLISYGDGSNATGLVYTDTVSVGGVSFATQAVEAASDVSSEFLQDQENDGLLGLSFSSINTVSPTPQKTFFDNVMSSLAQPVFAADLKYHAPGTYDFGFIDSSKYTGSLTYINVDSSQGFWGVSSTAYSVGSGSSKKKTITGIMDTGTTLIYIPSSVVSSYYSHVSGAQNDDTYGGYTVPCSATLPDFSVTFGGVKQTVPGKYINYAPVEDGSSTCFGGIQSSDSIGISIFGDIFLKSKYVVFQGGSSPRIGLGQQS